ncbi:Poly(U)-binding-splicing factor puf60 [Rhizophlyctis rosea]|nr:Poly(U)-binding-splicing factor puf60 [Rhizophlyctis rosea]
MSSNGDHTPLTTGNGAHASGAADGNGVAATIRRKRASAWDEQPDEKRVKVEVNTTALASPNTPSPTTMSTSAAALAQLARTVPIQQHLGPEQKARLERAKAFAREASLKLSSRSPTTPLIPSLTPAPGALEARSLAVMSRIYVGSINFELTEVHIKQVFSQFGYVKGVSMTIDPTTGKHKGFCFVEYEVPEAAQLALDVMNGSELGGRQLKVGRPNNYNNNIAITLPPPPPSRIYVANVNEYVSEDNLLSIFSAFGKVEGCALMPDPITRKHKSAGYIEFSEESEATQAINAMNGFELGGMNLRVMKALVGGPMPDGMNALDKIPVVAAPSVPPSVLAAASSINNSIAQKAGMTSPSATSLGMVGANPSPNLAINPPPRPPTALLTANLQNAMARVQEKVAEENAALEETFQITASQRYSLMHKLAKREEKPTPVIALRNMVTLGDAQDKELYEEIGEELEKYGRVVKVGTDGEGAKKGEDYVVIYVLYVGVDAAEKAKQALDKRFFNGKQISAVGVPEEEFRRRFDGA